jgi:hypothetical protein
VIPFDNTQNFSTGIAIVNPDQTRPSSVSAVFRDENGTALLTTSIPLNPQGQIPFEIRRQYPTLANSRGSVEFSDPTLQLFGLGLRFSPFNTFTSLPAIRK